MACGDIHGEWEWLNVVAERTEGGVVLACGDFGFWPKHRYVDEKTRELVPVFHPSYFDLKGATVYFCDGNHEDHWTILELIEKHGRRPIEVSPGIFLCPRGTVARIAGRNVLFFGGGFSIDREMRRFGHSWFPEEIPSEEDLRAALSAIEALKTRGEEVHIVVSHQAPRAFRFRLPWGVEPMESEAMRDVTRDMLDEILFAARPRLWLFGHWHAKLEGYFEKTMTRWYGLAVPPKLGWWKDLSPWFRIET